MAELQDIECCAVDRSETDLGVVVRVCVAVIITVHLCVVATQMHLEFFSNSCGVVNRSMLVFRDIVSVRIVVRGQMER